MKQNLNELDRVAGIVIDYMQKAGGDIIVVSEYGIEEVRQAVVLNRELRIAGLLAVAGNERGELVEPGNGDVFDACDD